MSPEIINLLIKSFVETCYMVAATIISTLIGLPLGVILTVTRKGHLENTPVNAILGAVVNAARSTPFIILMVAIIPLTRMIVGSSIGTTAAIVPTDNFRGTFHRPHHRVFTAGN